MVSILYVHLSIKNRFSLSCSVLRWWTWLMITIFSTNDMHLPFLADLANVSIFGLCNWKVSLSSVLLSVYSTPGHMADASDSICGTDMHIHPLYLPVRYLAYMPNLVGRFGFGTYLAITWSVHHSVHHRCLC